MCLSLIRIRVWERLCCTGTVFLWGVTFAQRFGRFVGSVVSLSFPLRCANLPQQQPANNTRPTNIGNKRKFERQTLFEIDNFAKGMTCININHLYLSTFHLRGSGRWKWNMQPTYFSMRHTCLAEAAESCQYHSRRKLSMFRLEHNINLKYVSFK